ncbi:MAG: hypothetical protein A3D21_05380 [Nitrospirae bacterium RIFCSPHIGHO2_02_FULL_42_12]|nr:MAG: hypothetical protein A3D21_05380 [Nitrospirae bacterium RIFCSPHIGHO2_02_FULL_42_12]HAS17988.1 hypothetical protein [Nitrospiraceae bacterium]
MVEYKTIVCPVDGSELTEMGEDAAAYISGLSGAKLILLHVVEKWYRSTHMATDSKEWGEIHEGWINEGKALLEKEVKRLKEKGVNNIETVIRDGEAAYEIVAVAREKQADLVVMSTHHYSAMGKLFMGSVTDRVTKKSPCPVLWVFR